MPTKPASGEHPTCSQETFSCQLCPPLSLSLSHLTHSRVNVHEAVVLEPQIEEIVLLHILLIQRLGGVQPSGERALIRVDSTGAPS